MLVVEPDATSRFTTCEEAMRYLVYFAAIIGLVGCSWVGAERVNAQRPSVSYEVTSDRQFQNAGMNADDWCSQNYGLRARLVDRRPASNASEVVVFDCVS
jgi:hypothetical protein